MVLYFGRQFLREVYDGQLRIKLKKGVDFPALDPWVYVVSLPLCFPYRSLSPGTGGMYQFVRLPVRGPSGTTKIDHQRSIEGEIDCRRLIERKKGKKKKRKRRKKQEEEKKKEYLAPSSPARCRRPRSRATVALARGTTEPTWNEDFTLNIKKTPAKTLQVQLDWLQ
ncbi:hypothetical protein GW17_00019200 [Ensete ventricosum]|nr:hypothetical protein GW17_00019200 [Ensete ventricosum]